MFKIIASLLAFVIASTATLAQQAAPVEISKLTPDQVKARDKFEDEIAQAIIADRQAAGLGTISRIRDKKLRKLTCTFAVKNDALGFGTESPLPSVQLVASSEEFSRTYSEWLKSSGGKEWTGGPKIERFAVGAWPAQEAEKYWIRFEYHPNAAAQWANNAFANDSKNGWKRVVAEPCKKVE
jgi:hypothetical protein